MISRTNGDRDGNERRWLVVNGEVSGIDSIARMIAGRIERQLSGTGFLVR